VIQVDTVHAVVSLASAFARRSTGAAAGTALPGRVFRVSQPYITGHRISSADILSGLPPQIPDQPGFDRVTVSFVAQRTSHVEA
jgi:hypothetical protein